MVYWPPYPWYFDPPTHGMSNPNHGILTSYPWYFYPSIYGILTPLPMVYWTPYPWYIESPTHVIFTSLLKGNVDDKWNIFVVIWPQIFYSGQPSHGGDRGTFEVMTST
jgi:hypothetical protein